MQRTEYRPPSVMGAFVSLPALLAVLAMVSFYCTITVPDQAVISGSNIEKPGQFDNRDVLKEAQKLKPYKLMKQGKLLEAVQLASSMQAANPNDLDTLVCASLVLYKGGSKEDGFTLMKRALGFVSKNQPLRLEYAKMLVDAGKLDEAITQYRLVMQQYPKATGPRMDLAQLYLSNGKPAEAAKELQELLKITPNDFSAHKVCGIALARSGKAQEGMDEYLNGMVTEHGAGRPEAVKFILGAWGDIDKAKYELEQQSSHNPDDPMPKLRLAEIYLYADHPEDAKQYLLDARKLAPNNPEIHRSLCVAYKRLGDNRQALTSFMQSVALEQEQNDKLKQKKLLSK